MEPQVTELLKQDSFGRVERIEVVGPAGAVATSYVRRVAAGGRLPGSAFVARRLLARERRALARLGDLDGVPGLREDVPMEAGVGSASVLVRSWIPGTALHSARTLPRDFFERLEDLVRALHDRRVCHNDLHKEANVLVRPDGSPALVDFQLSSVHGSLGRTFEVRVSEDLRHVEKHARRYRLAGRPAPAGEPQRTRRSFGSALWRRTGKPLYNLVTRRILGWQDGEPRRASSGPWPEWGPPLGPDQGRD